MKAGDILRVIYRHKTCTAAKNPHVRHVFTVSRLGGFIDEAGVEHKAHPAHYLPAMACPACGALRLGRAVIGRVVETIKCGARCRASKGPTCDCSCGGHNHGAN